MRARFVIVAAWVLWSWPAIAQQTTGQQPAAGRVAGYVPEFGTMWTFEAPPLDYWKTRYNFTPDAGWLDRVRLASVRLPGCSASFVSDRGLVMTNHHCARACITAVSPADTNYQAVGFTAPSQQQEKKCPGLYVDQLQSTSDVTARIRAKVTAATAATRVEQRDAEMQAIQRECQQSPTTICQVVGMYQGGMYSLYTYRRFSDVRLVMAPEETVSFFGGDPDNFTFPRYDLDVTLLRVYENEQAHRSENFLRWSAAGATEGELVFVTGNPGSTGRLLTVAQMEYLRDVQYPAQLARNIQMLRTLTQRSEAAKRQYENALFSAENSQKAITGYYAGLTDEKIMARKRAFERELRNRVSADARLRAEYGGAWAAIEQAETELKSLAKQARYYPVGGSTLLQFAGALVRLPGQEALHDSLRLAQYRGNALTNLKNQLSGAIPVDTMLERLNIETWLRAAQQELDPKDPLLVTLLAGRRPEQAAVDLLKATQLGDPNARSALMKGGNAAIAASKDPLIVAVRKLEPSAITVSKRVARLNSIISANAEKVGQAQFAVYGKALPPDATFTLRISDGVVKRLPHERHDRALQDQLLRFVRAQRRIRRPAALQPARTLEREEARARPVHALQFRFDQRHHRRQLRQPGHQPQRGSRRPDLRWQHRIPAQPLHLHRRGRPLRQRALPRNHGGATEDLWWWLDCG
ncbi:MAG: S46 family peptidase [Gemmatimonadota bacterium]